MFILPKLPYELRPRWNSELSRRHPAHHHDKHHRTYVEKTQRAGAQGPGSKAARRDVVRERSARATPSSSQRRPGLEPRLLWECMTPDKAQPPRP